MEEQERQVAQLRARIALLEGVSNPAIGGHNGNTVDDFSIKVRKDLMPATAYSALTDKIFLSPFTP